MKINKINLQEIVVIFVIVCLFISKGLFNLSILLLLLLSVVNYFKKKYIYKNKNIFMYFGLLIIGILSNAINSDMSGILNFISNERYFLYILCFVLLNFNLHQFDLIKKWILIGGLIALSYTIISFFTPKFLGIETNYIQYKKDKKMHSFQPGIRWGRSLQMLTLFSFIEFNKRKKWLLFLVSIAFIWAILVNGQRAAFVTTYISLTILLTIILFVYRNKQKEIFILSVLIMFLLPLTIIKYSPQIKTRITSIFQVNENISNKVRLGYWKIGLDMLKDSNYLGVGSGKIGNWKDGGEFKEFLLKKDKKYKKKYFKYEEGKPFENNYINLAVENGLVYLIFYLFINFLIFFKIFCGILKQKSQDLKLKLAIVFSILVGDKIYMIFYPDTDSYIEFLVVFLMFYGLKLLETIETTEKIKL